MSTEGTTQGDNTAMAFYAVSTHPLIKKLGDQIEKITQTWFADDSSAAGTLNSILSWWKKPLKVGPMYGYFPNPTKCVLIVKNEETRRRAEEMFGELGMEITTSGKRHLGAIIGSPEYKEEYVKNKVDEWVDDIQKLANIAHAEPQAAYAAMILGIQHRWKFIQRTVPDISDYFTPLDREIHHKLIPAIVGRQISDDERDILALPVRYGGLGIPRPNENSNFEYAASRKITQPLKESIVKQEIHPEFNQAVLKDVKDEIKRERENIYKQRSHFIMSHTDDVMKRSLEAAREKGASSWLTTLPLEWLGYTLPVYHRYFF